MWLVFLWNDFKSLNCKVLIFRQSQTLLQLWFGFKVHIFIQTTLKKSKSCWTFHHRHFCRREVGSVSKSANKTDLQFFNMRGSSSSRDSNQSSSHNNNNNNNSWTVKGRWSLDNWTSARQNLHIFTLHSDVFMPHYFIFHSSPSWSYKPWMFFPGFVSSWSKKAPVLFTLSVNIRVRTSPGHCNPSDIWILRLETLAGFQFCLRVSDRPQRCRGSCKKVKAYRSFKYELSSEAYGSGCMWSAH